MLRRFSRLHSEMTEKTHPTPWLTDFKMIATVLAPLAMAGAAIVAMRESH